MDHEERYNFTRFPYRKEVRESGEVNNGGFDLVQFPRKIDDIHEIREYPWLKEFISKINSKESLFMTFGCDIGYQGDVLYGYIDLSFRPTVETTIKEDLVNLDIHFYAYLSQAIEGEEIRQRAIQYIQKILLWLSSPLEIFGESYSKLNLTFREREQEGLIWAFDHLCYFFTEYYPANYK